MMFHPLALDIASTLFRNVLLDLQQYCGMQRNLNARA